MAKKKEKLIETKLLNEATNSFDEWFDSQELLLEHVELKSVIRQAQECAYYAAVHKTIEVMSKAGV